jgi:hypothetical protein
LPNFPGVCLDIVRAVTLGTVTADASGIATLAGMIPPDAAGIDYVQVLAQVGGQPVKTSVVTVDVVPDGVDSDGDMLQDADEVMRWNTDPNNPDGDGDNALDGVEVHRGLDPWDPDQDNDGILDGFDVAPNVVGPFDAFVADDQVVSDPAASLPDPEFDNASSQLVWEYDDGSELWVGDIDPATGALLPRDGRGTLIAVDVAEINLAKNGPEWMLSSNGSEVVYAKRIGADWNLHRAVETAPGLWTSSVVPDSLGGMGPIGSQDAGDPTPRALFLRQPGGVGYRLWMRELDDVGTERIAPQMMAFPRWVPGERAMVGSRDVNGIGRIAKWDLDTGLTEDLTLDGVDHGSVFFFNAPELGGEQLFFTTHAESPGRPETLVTWRRVGGVWQPQRQITMPPAFPFVISPEPFEWDGRSYVSFLASQEPLNSDNGRSVVYVATLIPQAGDAYRLISNSTPMIRKDPESYVGGARPWVYYTEVHPSGRRILHRCELGL